MEKGLVGRKNRISQAASPLVTAPPSNLTRLYYNGSAAKSHSTTTQYRQLRRLGLLPCKFFTQKCFGTF